MTVAGPPLPFNAGVNTSLPMSAAATAWPAISARAVECQRARPGSAAAA